MPEFQPPEVMSVLGLVDTYVQWENANQPPRGHERYHPSAFGNCLRKMQYQRYEERGVLPEPVAHEHPEPFLCRIFGNGHDMHDRWRRYFDGLNILRGYWQCMNPFCAAFDDSGQCSVTIQELMADPGEWIKKRRIFGKDDLQGCFKPQRCYCGWTKFHYHEIDVVDTELNFYGHCDIILDFEHFDVNKLEGVPWRFMQEDLPKGKVVVDMKSINYFDYKKVAEGNPHPYYLVQLMIYANVLQCDYGILIYENKNNQLTCAFRVDKNDDTLWQWVKHQAKQMNDMVDTVDEYGNYLHLLPPPRPVSQEEKECERCDYRPLCHKSEIWNDPELYQKRAEFYGDLLNNHRGSVPFTLPILQAESRQLVQTR